MSRHVTIRVYGRVQGVWFRKSSQDFAVQYGLAGYAKNNADGTVTIEAWGEEGDLNRLIAWCGDGSKYARVDDVDFVFDDLLNKEYRDFKIF